ncbi:2-amino-4-hydroxy-6-hydroxymethyldihydropteridine diphosphokinase [Ekhidna sp.]|uniref:2-amino-4-hydroxy-6- hydroxymethyldihydropteridine diphosphokinase n=1 Tax=Ekhidna sp. TaxID=2608089 RepID=UPI003511B63C
MNGIYLLLGSNMGNRLEYLREAEQLLIQHGIHVIDESSIYETEPWGKENQDWFLNVVLQIECSKSPEELLTTILSIEKSLGRIRKEKWGERSIDIDILYFHDEIVETDQLTVPHPGIPDRKFTLIPLVEMCPIEIHPTLNQNQMELLAACKDELDCKLTDYKL